MNPVRYYTGEPAPMGIADFGVTGKPPGSSGYEYFSPSFQGEAVVRSLSVSIGGTSSKVTAFELNAVVVLERNGINYSYWIQNGLHLDAGSHGFTIGGAYVWNFSSSGATLSPGELKGNAGSALATDTYYFIPGCGPTFPGQCSTLTLPATLTGRILTSTSAGIPYVAYEYNLGSGWVTYDNVSFAHLASASDSGFRVDGFVPTPYAPGLYYDAEWVWVGAGGGSASTDQKSDLNLSLSRWNGHNYQAIPTAWDFGSNTGETSTNVTEIATAPLGAHLASGPGTLGVLYNLSEVGFLNLSVPTSGPATVLVDGAAIPFGRGWANITLPVGSHSLYLQNFTNASDAFSIAAGATTAVNLSGAGEVTFNETGLAPGTPWGVSVSGTVYSTSGSILSLNLANGTYPVAYTAVAGYYRTGSNPMTLALPGTLRISLLFAQFTYQVSFTESGLPASTPWWINASGSQAQGTGTSLQVTAPNGSTPYEVGSLYEFLANPNAGSILVSAGVASPVDVAFSYRPTFIVGTVVPANAQVSIGGIVQLLAGGSFNDSVTPGSYNLVASAAGYVTDRLMVTATPGNHTWENLTLVANQTHSPVPQPTTGGGISPLTAALVLAAVAAVAVVAVIVLGRRRP
ncbi:MAG: thermopsin [Thermoplasmata archaeon]|nr:thermopsin [Thermoplasmata archaeon]